MNRSRDIVDSMELTGPRLRASVVVGLVALIGCTASDIAQAQVRAYTPTDQQQVIVRLDGAQAQVDRLRKASAAAPNDADLLTRYVDTLIAYGQRTGNERYFGHAEHAIANAPPAIQPALARQKAQLLQQRHDFAGAADVLTAVLARNPRDTQARLMRSQIYFHLNRVVDARRDCETLLLQVDLLTGATCLAQTRAAQGDVQRAYELLNRTLRATSLSSDATPDERRARSWSAGVVGELAARSGDSAAAGHWYRIAYELDSATHYPRIAYVDWLLSVGDFAQAEAIAARGQSPADHVRRVLAQRSPDSAEARRLRLGWSEASACGERNHLRDQARFELWVLNDSARAHVTALDNFADHQTPEDALLLATTASAVGDAQAIARVHSWRQVTGYRDVRLENPPRAATRPADGTTSMARSG